MEKTCSKCKVTKGAGCFHKKAGGKDGLRSHCKSCVKEYQKTCKNRPLTVTLMEKKCTACGEVKPVEQFSKKAREKDKLDSWCKSCQKEYQKTRKDRSCSVTITEKKCTACGEVKPVGQFSKNAREKDKLDSRCKSCVKEYQKTLKNRLCSVTITEKKCTACGEVKPVGQFSKKASGKDKLDSRCKSCVKEYRKTLKDRPFTSSVTEKKCTVCGVVKSVEKFHKWSRGKDKLNSWCKDCQKEYQHNNRQAINERSRRRRATDENFRLACNLRNRIRKVLSGSKKSSKTFTLVGCTVSQLRLHLESQFHSGMTWEVYGSVWHVDHIVPCCFFDLPDEADQKACFHYTNLQPLLASENISKSGSLSAIVPIDPAIFA